MGGDTQNTLNMQVSIMSKYINILVHKSLIVQCHRNDLNARFRILKNAQLS